MKPAWRGIAGWVLIVLAFVIAATMPWPLNGLAALALVIGVAGAWLVAVQLGRTEAGARLDDSGPVPYVPTEEAG